jgi:transposase
MRFLTPKTEWQKTLSTLHRVRESLIRDRTKTINQIRGFLLEIGISIPIGKSVITRLPAVLEEHSLPACFVSAPERLHEHLKYVREPNRRGREGTGTSALV